jgi:TonB family protein
VKKGQTLSVLAEDESWMRVKLASGETGWVASRFVSRDGDKAASGKKKSKAKKTSCPADSDFAFVETPTLAFSETPKPGMVVVEASVNTKGAVTSTKVVSNSTGDEALAFLAQREIRSATFAPPIRNCAPRAFIFTYRRTF